MRCPSCAAPLIVLEVDRVEIDHCTACGGVWLDGGELELLLGAAANLDTLMATLKSGGAAKEARLRCPICRRKLDKVSCGEGETVALDKCPRDHGLWFDRGELQAVIAMGDFPAGNRIYQIINDIFGGVGNR